MSTFSRIAPELISLCQQDIAPWDALADIVERYNESLVQSKIVGFSIYPEARTNSMVVTIEWMYPYPIGGTVNREYYRIPRHHLIALSKPTRWCNLIVE